MLVQNDPNKYLSPRPVKNKEERKGSVRIKLTVHRQSSNTNVAKTSNLLSADDSREPTPNRNVPQQSSHDESMLISKIDKSGVIEFDLISEKSKRTMSEIHFRH